MLTSGKEIKTQFNVMQRKMQDVKNEFGSINVIKMHYDEKVMIINVSVDICVYVASCVLRSLSCSLSEMSQ